MEKKEYIEHGALIRELHECGIFPVIVRRTIERAPAADVVEVVRCKDCKRSGMYDFGCGDRVHFACLEIEEDGFVIMATAVNDDDFCSRGERREE